MLRTTTLAALACALALACGSSSTNAPRGTAGAGSSSGGASSGGVASGGGVPSAAGTGSTSGGSGGTSSVSLGGSGGSLVLGDTLAEACIAYALASCLRNAECDRRSTDCLNATLECPDLIASAGSTRTVAELKACAEVYRTLSCDDVLTGKLPPCVTPGTLAAGEPCMYPSQCASLDCLNDGYGCGVCSRPVATGEECDLEETGCAHEDKCTDFTCTPRVRHVFTIVADAGASCALEQPCTDGYICQGAGGTSATGTCNPLPAAGESCALLYCAPGNYCLEGDLICTPDIPSGQPCGFSSSLMEAFYCGGDLTCHYGATAATGTCLPFPKLGEPCVANPDHPDDEPRCAAELKCDRSVSPPLCVPKYRAGDPCTFTCGSTGLQCECAEGSPNCEARACFALGYADQPCTGRNVRCHAAFKCEAGVCKPRDADKFAAAMCE